MQATCGCGQAFFYRPDFYQERGLISPKRCRACRAERREKRVREERRAELDAERRLLGNVETVGPEYGFVRSDGGELYWFSVQRLAPAMGRLWPGDAVSFVPLLRTAAKAKPGNRPIAACLRRVA